MNEDSFSYKTLRNSVYLFANFLLPMAFTIFLTRSMALNLGEGEFGVMLLVNAISSFVNYVDLGLSTAVTKYSAEYKGSGNIQALTELLSSSRLLFLATGLIGLLVFFVLGVWFLPLFNITGGSIKNISVVFILAGLTFLLSSLTTVYSAVLTALQRFDLLTKLSLAMLFVNSIGSIILLEMNFRLKALMSLNLFLALVTLVFFHFYVKKLMPELKLSFKLYKHELIKAYKFGAQAFASNLAGTLLNYLDRLIIPIFLGPAMLPYYSVPGNIAIKTSVVTNTFGLMLFPMASEFAGSGEVEKLKNVYIRSFRNLHIIAAAVTVAIIFFAEKILYFWLGADYAERSSKILVILALTYFVVGLYIPLQGMLLGLGKLKFLIKQSLFMAVLNFILLLILVPRFGIMGAAWAYLISVLPMAYAFYWTEKNIFQIPGQFQNYVVLYAKLLFTAFIAALIMKFLLVGLVTTTWALVVIGPFSVVLYFILYYFFGFMNEEDVSLVKSFLFKFLRLK